MPGCPRVVTPDTPLPQRIALPRTNITPQSTWAPLPPLISDLCQRCPDVAPVTPRRIKFADIPPPTRDAVPPPRVGISPPPRVAIKPAVPYAPALPPRIPIAHRTRSRANAPLALFFWPNSRLCRLCPYPKECSEGSSQAHGICWAVSGSRHDISLGPQLCPPLPCPVGLRSHHGQILGALPATPQS